MAFLTMVFGCVLVAVGAFGYDKMGPNHQAILLPVFQGLLLVSIASIGRNANLQRVALLAASGICVIGCVVAMALIVFSTQGDSFLYRESRAFLTTPAAVVISLTYLLVVTRRFLVREHETED